MVEDVIKKPLLVIELQDLDSVPAVYYKGQRMFDNRLVSALFNWEANLGNTGKQSIEIKGYDIDGYKFNNVPSLDTIKHERLTGE